MPIKVNGATSGSVTLAAPSTGSDVTTTLPNTTVDLSTSFGAWAAYTPSFSGASIGNGTLKFAYCQIGKVVHVRGQWTLGSTSSITGPLDISLPVAQKSTYDLIHPLGVCNVYDVSAGMVSLCQALLIGVSTIRIVTTLTNATYAAHAEVSGSAPFTWASGDYLFLSVTYEAA